MKKDNILADEKKENAWFWEGGRERERETTLCEKKIQEERRRWSPVCFDFGLLI